MDALEHNINELKYNIQNINTRVTNVLKHKIEPKTLYRYIGRKKYTITNMITIIRNQIDILKCEKNIDFSKLNYLVKEYANLFLKIKVIMKTYESDFTFEKIKELGSKLDFIPDYVKTI